MNYFLVLTLQLSKTQLIAKKKLGASDLDQTSNRLDE